MFFSSEGVVPLTFESSLQLKDVENENKRMSEGEYEPSDCTARQSVAILIPHRNRERHLLYLLHHLLPFLQRQQLHYAIYVIHQVVLGTMDYCNDVCSQGAAELVYQGGIPKFSHVLIL